MRSLTRNKQSPTLDAVVRDLWTDDLIRARASHVWRWDDALGGRPGPPWYFLGYVGDRMRFSCVNVDMEFISTATPKALMEEIDSLVVEALDIIRSVRITTSEALVAGESRRCLRH